MKPNIIVRRYFDDEPPDIELEFIVSNGEFSGRSPSVYTTSDTLLNMGKFLIDFPQKYPDEYCFEYGQEKQLSYFKMQIYTENTSTGAISFSIIDGYINDWLGEKKICKSYFPISDLEFSALRQLGEVLITFANLEHEEFHWFRNGSYNLYDKLL